MKKVFMLVAAVGCLGLSSCGITRAPVMGGIYTDVTSGTAVTSNSLATKVGKASASSILNVFATGDASFQTAAKNGGIKRITHVDEHNKTILGIITTHEIIVYGE